MRTIMFAVSLVFAAELPVVPAIAQQYPSCTVDRDYPGSYAFCRYYWRSLGGAGQNGHVSPYQDDYGRDVARPGHHYH
jgi:hypothetical protein